MNSPESLFRRFRDLQEYVGWQPQHAQTLQEAFPFFEPAIAPLIDDFYSEIQRHAETRRVITGGPAQIASLKQTLKQWLADLFSGQYDASYVMRRWRVGYRHVEIGLDQVYTNVALSRLRSGLLNWLRGLPDISAERRSLMSQSLISILDLDLAIIEDAYQAATAEWMQRIERLATIGQVAGGVAHELRNPLNVIKTSVYYLLHAKSPCPEKIAEHLQRIDAHVGQADGVITALSNFSRLPHPDSRPLAISECIRQALEATPLPRQVDFSLNVDQAVPLVRGDAGQLQIVFSNLLRNAREAMPDGGRLNVSVYHRPPFVEVAVCDTGVGIADEHLGRIMEPLYTTKARGIGLGLAISRAIVQKHQGDLRVESQPGLGSTFFVRLPAANRDAAGTP